MRHYKLKQLAAQTGVSARTISSYVSKGLLSGPSHRGRGAVYPQRDLHALQVIPRIRVLMPAHYPDLRAIARLLKDISTAGLRRLATLDEESDFLNEMRKIHQIVQLHAMYPDASPEHIASLARLPPPAPLYSKGEDARDISAVMAVPTILANSDASAHQWTPQPLQKSSSHWELNMRGIEIRIDQTEFTNASDKSEIVAAIRSLADNLEHLTIRSPEIHHVADRSQRAPFSPMEATVGARA